MENQEIINGNLYEKIVKNLMVFCVLNPDKKSELQVAPVCSSTANGGSPIFQT